MTPGVSLPEWLALLKDEYTSAFLPAGGATIKFIVPVDGTPAADVAAALGRTFQESNFVVASVNAAETRLHMIDQLFFSVARQVPWQQLASERILALAEAERFSIPATVGAAGVAREVAEESGLDQDHVHRALEVAIANEVFKDRDLARDYRLAMTALCRAALAGDRERATSTMRVDIASWLTGSLRLVSSLKPYGIHTKINRANARHHFMSLFEWVPKAGRAGTAITVDCTRILETGRPGDGSLTYTRSAVMDAYELMRQFIDGADEVRSAFIAFLLPASFLDRDNARWMGLYPALMYRIYDEIRDTSLLNPLSSLVPLVRS